MRFCKVVKVENGPGCSGRGCRRTRGGAGGGGRGGDKLKTRAHKTTPKRMQWKHTRNQTMIQTIRQHSLAAEL